MVTEDFHEKPFDEGTLTKLDIFELYAREWIPVFLSSKSTSLQKVRIFDFFAGPGTDSHGEFGSPLRLLRQLKDYTHLQNCGKLTISAHLFDEDENKIQTLKSNIESHGLNLA
ncbi:MAG: three-Cys-motif partner protein TcmP, partial [Limisphaerales bacterium]